MNDKLLLNILAGAAVLGTQQQIKKPFIAAKIPLTKKQKRNRAKNKVQKASRKVNR